MPSLSAWPPLQKIINVNFAKPLKTALGSNKAVWQDEEWIKQYANPTEGDGSSAAPPAAAASGEATA